MTVGATYLALQYLFLQVAPFALPPRRYSELLFTVDMVEVKCFGVISVPTILTPYCELQGLYGAYLVSV